MVMSDLIIEKNHGLGSITLNRPNALNAINLNMVRVMHATLLEWASDPQVKAVLVKGAGEKAFCAGGDIRSIYESVQAGSLEHMDFFREEFALNQYIYNYPKPYIALMTGYVMGGGMGISQGATFRVVTSQSKISMPEVGIGYFPDVGGSYFLPRCRGVLGLYLGITGVIASGEDALYANLADWLIPHEKINDLIDGLVSLNLAAQLPGDVKSTIEQFFQEIGGRQEGLQVTLQKLESAIERHFQLDSISAIMASLQNETDPERIEWAQKTGQKMQRQSPLSMIATQRLIQLGRHKNLAECFAMEYALIPHWMQDGDFVEGVRALIIDKDNQPKWRSTLAQISTVQMDGLFKDVIR